MTAQSPDLNRPNTRTEMEARLAGLKWGTEDAQGSSMMRIGLWICRGRLTLPDALAYLATVKP